MQEEEEYYFKNRECLDETMYLHLGFHFYLAPQKVTLAKNDPRKEYQLWKKKEIVFINGPTKIDWGGRDIINIGFLYFVEYSLDYIVGEEIFPKSKEFIEFAGGFVKNLQQNFGFMPGTLDNYHEIVRLNKTD